MLLRSLQSVYASTTMSYVWLRVFGWDPICVPLTLATAAKLSMLVDLTAYHAREALVDPFVII